MLSWRQGGFLQGKDGAEVGRQSWQSSFSRQGDVWTEQINLCFAQEGRNKKELSLGMGKDLAAFGQTQEAAGSHHAESKI